MANSDLLRRVRTLLDDAAVGGKPDEITLRHALNETWFSDALAWLLDPRGDHGLGVRFLRGFLKAVAKERCREGGGYARRVSHLRWSTNPGRGQRATILRLANAASFREFYLAGGAKRSKRGDRYCDVVVLDLDSADGLVLVVENKLFGSNSTGQLRDQILSVEEKYSRAKIREYVYLTLNACQPTSNLKDEKPLLPRWVALGWLTDILELINNLEPRPDGRLRELAVLLRWLKGLSDRANSEPETVEHLIESVLDGTAGCLLFELNRLCGSGNWTRPTTGAHQLRLAHSAAPKRYLSVKLLANCSVVVQSKSRGKPRCDKLHLPFGAPARQVFNLMHITARDLYWLHFDKPRAFLRNTVRKKLLCQKEESFTPMLNFISKHRFELQALLGVSRCGGGLEPPEALP